MTNSGAVLRGRAGLCLCLPATLTPFCLPLSPLTYAMYFEARGREEEAEEEEGQPALRRRNPSHRYLPLRQAGPPRGVAAWGILRPGRGRKEGRQGRTAALLPSSFRLPADCHLI